ncbi:MAG: hypothetical protein LRY52_00140 [Sulfurospirillum cavolei]|nr:hypothetical protein [Sulfurospirillum cavolei]
MLAVFLQDLNSTVEKIPQADISKFYHLLETYSTYFEDISHQLYEKLDKDN